MDFKKFAQMIKVYQAAMPPQGMPPAGAPAPMPPQGAPMPTQGAPAGDPNQGMPPQGAPAAGGPPPMDPLLDQMLQVFGQLPPGMFSEMVSAPLEVLVQAAQSGQVPPMAVQLVLHLRQGGSGMEQQQPQGDPAAMQQGQPMPAGPEKTSSVIDRLIKATANR